MSKDNGGPAFPVECTNNTNEVEYGAGFCGEDIAPMSSIEYPGMPLRQYAAIHLKVADSGEEWLDEMIRQSIWQEDARAALQGWIIALTRRSGEYGYTDTGACYEAVRLADDTADHMLKARGEG